MSCGRRPRRRREAHNTRLKVEFDERYRAWEWRKAEHDAAEFSRYQRESDGVWDDPEAMEARVSGYRQTIDPATGSEYDQYLYSVKVTREQ